MVGRLNRNGSWGARAPALLPPVHRLVQLRRHGTGAGPALTCLAGGSGSACAAAGSGPAEGAGSSDAVDETTAAREGQFYVK
jgi:hypothetical protein